MNNIDLIIRGIKQLERDMVLTKSETIEALEIIQRRENLFQCLLSELEKETLQKRVSGE